jgi:hypothetical protein
MAGAAALQIENAELTRLKRRVFTQEIDDLPGIGPLLQLGKDEHLILVRVVDAGLTCRDTLARHDDRLHAHQELVVVVHARGRRDDDAARALVDGDHGPGGRCGRRHEEAEPEK